MYQPMPAPGQAAAVANRNFNAFLTILLGGAFLLAIVGTGVNTVGVISEVYVPWGSMSIRPLGQPLCIKIDGSCITSTDVNIPSPPTPPPTIPSWGWGSSGSGPVPVPWTPPPNNNGNSGTASWDFFEAQMGATWCGAELKATGAFEIITILALLTALILQGWRLVSSNMFLPLRAAQCAMVAFILCCVTTVGTFVAPLAACAWGVGFLPWGIGATCWLWVLSTIATGVTSFASCVKLHARRDNALADNSVAFIPTAVSVPIGDPVAVQMGTIQSKV